jgi:hypothetical protein
VRSGEFPEEQHTSSIPEEELALLRHAVQQVEHDHNRG